MISARVLIFECDHRLQRTCTAFTDSIRQGRHEDQQRCFSAMLAELLRDGVTFIGEEIGYTQTSIAQGLALAFRCSYSWIDMPLAERNRLGCPHDYDVLLKIDGSHEDVMRCHRLREKYMYDRIVEHLNAGGSGLVLCGKTHAERLRTDLVKTISQVELKSLTDCDWFDKALYQWQE